MTQTIIVMYETSLKSIANNSIEVSISQMESILTYAKFFTESNNGSLRAQIKPLGLELLFKLNEEVMKYYSAKHLLRKAHETLEGDKWEGLGKIGQSVMIARINMYSGEVGKVNTNRISQMEEILAAFQYRRVYQRKW